MSGTIPAGLWPERDPQATRCLYAGWAETYDADMAAGGMLGPARVAAMLARFVPDREALLWDFGCGTGLSGAALREAGYARIRGYDISPEMVERARARGIYEAVELGAPDAPPPVPAEAGAVVACGSICIGAAPAALLGAVLGRMTPGAVLVTSYNDSTLASAPYHDALRDLQTGGLARLERLDYGPQLPALGRGAAVLVLRRL
jgi:SAM-dependent methyltransferase